MIEVELKFAVPSEVQARLQAQIAALPDVKVLGQRHSLDEYYDTSDYTCFRQAVFLRIRNHAYLEIKYHEQDDPSHMHSSELIFPLESDASRMKELNSFCARVIPAWQQADSVSAAFNRNALNVFVPVEKQRTQYEYQQFLLCIDQVAGLGDFLEVEVCCEDGGDVEPVIADLHAFVASLAIPQLRPVQIGYVELWLRQHLPAVYQLGQYQEENHF